MSEAVATPTVVPHTTLRDLLTLTKPGITAQVLVTTAGAFLLATGPHPARLIVLTLFGVALVVGGANALNMYMERDVDGLMRRTASRPLPTGRMAPSVALAFGALLGLFGVPLLAVAVNPLTGALGLLAILLYLLAYTPLKRRSWVALIVGAVPGAMPPLLGWTAATGHASTPGIVLFAILFFWQIPHFVAISLFRDEDYRRAGLKTLPAAHGPLAAKLESLVWIAALVAASLALVPLGVAGKMYMWIAAALGGMFFVSALLGLRPSAGTRWARTHFFVSLIYLTGLFIALVATAGRP